MMQTMLPLASKIEVYRWFVGFVCKNKARVFFMLFFYIIALVFGLIGPQLLGHLVESVQVSKVDRIAIFFLVVVVSQSFFTWQAYKQSSILGENFLATSREDYVNHVIRLPLTRVESVSSGDLLSRASSDVDLLNEGIRFAMPSIVLSALSIFFILIAIVCTSPILSLTLIVGVPFSLMATIWYRSRVAWLLEKFLSNSAHVLTSINETVNGAYTVEALHFKDKRMADFKKKISKKNRSKSGITFLQAIWLPSLDLTVMLPMILVLLFGVIVVRRGMVTVGELTTTVLYILALADPLNDMLTWTDEIQIGFTALKRILGIKKIPIVEKKNYTICENPTLKLIDVNYVYDSGLIAVQDINLTIYPGEHIVIVGGSGAGKTTLARLIAGIDLPSSGNVTLAGMEVSELSLAVLRKEVFLVMQENYIFSGSILDNLLIPKNPYDRWSKELINDVLDQVDLTNWIHQLPQGLDTQIGASETVIPEDISQKIALARALLAAPNILILDEATAALDIVTATHIEKMLKKSPRLQTIISIIHRLDAALYADKIIVMDKGKILETGTHEQLINKKGKYSQLWAIWNRENNYNAL